MLNVNLPFTKLETILILEMLLVAILGVQLLRYISDMKLLKQGIRKYLKTGYIPGNLPLHTFYAHKLWNSVTAIKARQNSNYTTSPKPEEIIQAGSEIIAHSDNSASAISQVTKLLKSFLGDDLIAIAFIIRNSTSEDLEVSYLEGVPSNRADSVLLEHFESLSSDSSDSPVIRDLLDDDFLGLATFNIALSISIPFDTSGFSNGGIWLGFRKGSRAISTKARAYTLAISRQAACCFHAARRVESRAHQSGRERDFLIGISHDLRAPGTSALFVMRNLLAEENNNLTIDQRFKLSVIQNSLEDQLGILSDVLNYAQLQKGILNSNIAALNLALEMKKLVNTYSFSAETRGLTLSSAPVPEMFILADPGHFKRIIANVLSNAIKYTQRGFVHIDYMILEDTLSISISDSGPGIAIDQQELIFKEFTRLNHNKKVPGTGLGLAITKELIELNGGRIDYQPRKEGTGSHFTMSFRRVPKGYSHCVCTSKTTAILKSILVLDDDPASCRSLIRSVKPLAHHAQSTYTIKDAISSIISEPPDLIICDLNINGDCAFTLLDTLLKKGIKIPTLIVTGELLPATPGEYKKTIPLGILQKPVDQQCLHRAILELSTART